MCSSKAIMMKKIVYKREFDRVEERQEEIVRRRVCV